MRASLSAVVSNLSPAFVVSETEQLFESVIMSHILVTSIVIESPAADAADKAIPMQRPCSPALSEEFDAEIPVVFVSVLMFSDAAPDSTVTYTLVASEPSPPTTF